MKIEEIYNDWKALFPLSEKHVELLRNKFTTEYNYNSNHIEGNTLTYGQTELLLLFGKVSGEGDLKDFVDMKASQVGVEMVMEAVRDKGIPLTQNFIRQLHKVLLREDYTVYRDLPGGGQTSYTVHAGQYKTRPNSVITRYGDRFEYASPEETASLMSDLVDWYNAAEQEGKLSPVELAALFHYRYIRIHPFEDGNGRIARLLMNFILLRHGYPMIVIRSKNKKTYLDALGKADKNVGPVPSDGANATLEQAQDFVNYITKQVEQTLEDDMNFLQEKEDAVWWFDGEFVTFKNESTIQLLKLLTDNPKMSVRSLAQTLGISKSAVQKQLKLLQEKGYILKTTNNNTSGWSVSIKSVPP